MSLFSPFARGIVFLGLLPALGSSLNGCQSPANQRTEATVPKAENPFRQRVMHLHDSLMAQMDPLHRERNRLRALLRSADQAPDTTVRAVHDTRRRLIAGISALDSAEEAMFDWMNAFREPADSIRQDKARESAFWRHQQESLHEVDCDMARALGRSQQLQ